MIIALITGSGFAAYRHFARSPEVNMVFTSNDCGAPCQSALVHLQRAGVDFTECNVDDSQEYLEKFMKYRSNSLPLGIINNKILIGYNQATYQDVINELRGTYLQESGDAVVMYSTQGCGYCRRAREFFAEHNIQYIENDIANQSNRRRYEELGGRGVPLILIRGTRIDGFQQKAIAKALRNAGLL
jgi:glutaredoxin